MTRARHGWVVLRTAVDDTSTHPSNTPDCPRPARKGRVTMDSYCTVSDCERPTREGRSRCEMHEKRYQRRQPLDAPVAERLNPKERLLEAAHRWVESDAENDAEFQRHERAVIRAARQLAPQASSELIRAAMADARARGVRLGRPPKVSAEQARQLVERLGTVTLAALALGVDRATVRRALARGAEAPMSHHTGTGQRQSESTHSAPGAVASAR